MIKFELIRLWSMAKELNWSQLDTVMAGRHPISCFSVKHQILVIGKLICFIEFDCNAQSCIFEKKRSSVFKSNNSNLDNIVERYF